MSHSGGLNSSGCHAGSKPYHCHRSASEMTTNSSGGNRLKCSAGSTSKDCSNNVSSQSMPSNSGQKNTNSEAAITVLSGTKNVADADGAAITILGFNYDVDQDLAIKSFVERFNCKPYTLSKECMVDDKLISWSKDSLGAIQEISFNCAAFNGCAYSGSEILQNLSNRFQLVNQVEDNEYQLCDRGVAGERICVRKNSKRIVLSKDKFRQTPMNFD